MYLFFVPEINTELKKLVAGVVEITTGATAAKCRAGVVNIIMSNTSKTLCNWFKLESCVTEADIHRLLSYCRDVKDDSCFGFRPVVTALI